MCGDALYMFLKPNSKMTKNLLNGIGEFVWVKLLDFDDLFETVNHTGVDDCGVESIFNGSCQRNCEIYAEEEFNEAGNIMYPPPPLHEVWLETSRKQRSYPLVPSK